MATTCANVAPVGAMPMGSPASSVPSKAERQRRKRKARKLVREMLGESAGAVEVLNFHCGCDDPASVAKNFRKKFEIPMVNTVEVYRSDDGDGTWDVVVHGNEADTQRWRSLATKAGFDAQ